jgi:hypothetical protein
MAIEPEAQVFPIARGSSATLWFIGGLVAFLIVVPLFLVIVSCWPWSGRSLVSPASLKVEGSSYGREIPMSALRVSEARRLTSTDTPAFWPAWRSNGIGLPSYQAGWFQLNNQMKALLFVTDWSRSVIVPTQEGFTLLLSPDDPDEFLDALRESAVATRQAGTPIAPPRTFTFTARPPSRRDISLPVALAMLLPVMIGVPVGLLAWTSRRIRFELSGQGLRIRGPYGRLIPREGLMVAEAGRVDLKTDPSFRGMIRTNGIGMPGCLAGWCRFRGGSKGLAFVTDQTRVVAVPTSLGFTLLLSPADPERFLESLRR